MKMNVSAPRFLKSLILVLAASLLAVGISGCAGGGEADPPAESPAIYTLMDRFEQGVEAYDVTKMTDCLTASFTLTLCEGGLSYTKDRATLDAELAADERDQLYWRAEYGYHLDLEFSPLVVAVQSATSATVTARFYVYEGADRLSPPIATTITDQGELSGQLAKADGIWKLAAMTISYDTPTAAARPASALPTGLRLPGAGFFRRGL